MYTFKGTQRSVHRLFRRQLISTALRLALLFVKPSSPFPLGKKGEAGAELSWRPDGSQTGSQGKGVSCTVSGCTFTQSKPAVL